MIGDYVGTHRTIVHAPIIVILDHYHKKGEWMISARQNHLEMFENIFNVNAISVADVLVMPRAFGTQPE